jgi:AtzE family amidohydrolase
MKEDFSYTGALALACAIKSGRTSSVEVVRSTLQRIQAIDPVVNAFTAITAGRALAEAEEIDRAIARGEDPGPLTGVPFAVKNLFDIQGLPTLAGSKLRAGAAVAERDAAAVRALARAGAVLVGALNMDEFAYGFTTENTHYGVTRNPHDLSRVAGGSSGGSAAAVAAGLVPLSLGSDTNGSIRVPSAFCGIFGLKPTYGRLSRRGTFQFVESLDCIGPFARSVEDLAAAFDAMQGPDPLDPVCTKRAVELCVRELPKGADGLRIAVAGDYFTRRGEPDAFEAVARVARALGAVKTVTIPEAARARAAAYVITGSEGGNHHLQDLRTCAADYDPLTRSRLLAGALIPAAWVNFAQRFRSWYREQVLELFGGVDVILAPSTPCPATQIGQSTMVLDGKQMLSRPNIGIFTQPISFIGLPVVSAPVHLPGRMPLGVQLIGAPYREAQLLRVAHQLEQEGVATAPVATQFQGELA